MQRAVMLLMVILNLAGYLYGQNGTRHEHRTSRRKCMAACVELRLQKMSSRS